MNEKLAGQLLAAVMQWGPPQVSEEQAFLNFIASYKYDDYQPFFPGMRYIESLALWLSQFSTIEERKTAYLFIKNKLIYLSYDEMEHLIEMAYPDCLEKILMSIVAKELSYNEWEINKILTSIEYQMSLRQTMFLGLSDGAHIGLFRRSNPHLSHEQIFRTHEISEGRAENMLEELATSIKSIGGEVSDYQFKNVVLLDDFSASGKSYLRNEHGKYRGKIAKFYNMACKEDGSLYGMFDKDNLKIYLLLYTATAEAKEYIKKTANSLFTEVPFEVHVINELSKDIKFTKDINAEFYNMIKVYYDNSIETPSYKKGKHDEPYLGFNECALPLVLYHNTPNNTLPLLWFEYNKRDYRGLFPRINRHSD